MKLTKGRIDTAISEIKGQSEIRRRLQMLRRHLIYKDAGEKFLLEAIRREFNEEAVKEMRMAPINLLKKVINKRSTIYSRPPLRKAEVASDQALMDHYVTAMSLDTLMQRCNRYFNLFSNTVIYVLPDGKGSFKGSIIPPYLYSVLPNKDDRTKIECFCFNTFTEEHRAFASDKPQAPTGRDAINTSPGFTVGARQDEVASNEYPSTETRQYIFWTDEEQVTVNEDGEEMDLAAKVEAGLSDADAKATVEQENRDHGLGMIPVVNVAKDRDNEPWAIQGEDIIALSIALQLGWTDLLTVAKHQGFSVLTIVSTEAPQSLKIGVNSAVWLKQSSDPNVPSPTMEYKSSSSNLDQYKGILVELLGLLLTTNEMSPKTLGSVEGGRSATSGFQALIEMADTLEAREQDKPHMLSAEKELWQVIKAYHNRYFDVTDPSQCLCEDAKALGKFSEEFDPAITHSEVQPLESDDERTKNAILKMEAGLSTRKRAMKQIYPDMTDEQIDAELKAIDDEKAQAVKTAQANMNAMGGVLPLPKVPGQTDPTASAPPATTPEGDPGDEPSTAQDPGGSGAVGDETQPDTGSPPSAAIPKAKKKK